MIDEGQEAEAIVEASAMAKSFTMEMARTSRQAVEIHGDCLSGGSPDRLVNEGQGKGKRSSAAQRKSWRTLICKESEISQNVEFVYRGQNLP